MSPTVTLPPIAIVGLPGSGKSTLVDHFTEQLGFERVYFGGIVLDEVKRRGLAINPDNEKVVRESLREEYGMAAIAELAVPAVDRSLKTSGRVVIDGLYGMAEYDVLRSNYSNLQTVAVHAMKSLRYRRLAERPRRPLNANEAEDRDRAEIRNLDKAAPIALADFHYVNDASPGKLGEFGSWVFTKIWETAALRADAIATASPLSFNYSLDAYQIVKSLDVGKVELRLLRGLLEESASVPDPSDEGIKLLQLIAKKLARYGDTEVLSTARVLVRSDNPNERLVLAWIVDELRDPTFIDYLSPLLTDDDDDVFLAASLVISRFGDAGIDPCGRAIALMQSPRRLKILYDTLLRIGLPRARTLADELSKSSQLGGQADQDDLKFIRDRNNKGSS